MKARVLFLTVLLLATGCSSRGKNDVDGIPLDVDNVILITIDTLRSDRLGCTGHGAARTPVLDALAREGVLFDTVVVPVPITLPSHASLMTGYLPHEMEIRDNRPFALSRDLDTLAEIMSRSGYQTIAVVAGEPLERGCGLEQGFDVYRFDPAPRRASVLLRESPADRTVDAALEATASLEREPDGRPFFLWVHFFDPHVPYDAPLQVVDGDAYDGEVAFVDREIGRLLRALDSRGLLERSLLVVTADHGEGLGDHGEATHAYFLYDTTLTVPMIVKGPGIGPGRRANEQVRLVDLKGTILALLGLSGARNQAASGDLAAFLAGAGREPKSAPAFAESLFCNNHFKWAQLASLRTDAFKVVRGARTEVFDLAADPGEAAPIAPRNASPEAQALVSELEERLGRARPIVEKGERLWGSLPGYLGGTAGYDQPFVDTARNAELPHPTDNVDQLGRFLKAVELAEAGLVNRARALLEDLYTLDQRNPSYAFWLGRVLRSIGEKEGNSRLMNGAADLFRHAHDLDPAFVDAFYMYLWTQIQMGEFDLAKSDLDAFLSRHEDDPKALELYGYLLTTEVSNNVENPHHDMDAGIELFEKSINLNQNNAGLLQKLVSAYKSLNNSKRAEYFERLLRELEPNQ